MKFGNLITGTLAAAALLACVSSAAGQAVAPLIREEPEIKVRVGTPTPIATPSDDDRGRPAPTPTPDPKTVLVAIVNSHSITRDQLDRRVTARIGTTPEALKEFTQKGVNILASDAPTEEALLDAQQEMEFQDAVRKEEGLIVQEWTEQMMLADEARRQGFVISEQEFKDRLRIIETEFNLSDSRVQTVLERMGMSNEELESYVHDALLIEKLLDRFVELNISDDALKAAYEQNPSIYRTPPMYRAAHFSISLLGSESAKTRRSLEKLAEEARSRLEKGENYDRVFTDLNDLDFGIYGADLGYFSIEQEGLPPVVRQELAKMKIGETSPMLTSYVRRDGVVVPESYHVVKVLDKEPAVGENFESALPKLRENAREYARIQVLKMLRDARTHKVITNLGGIPPEKIPGPMERNRPQPAVSLKMKK
ncbi:peptidyl-prolyl cis-trans isomerase [bacterium]|nr:peptidyl-prolyl cis-trans isomerase [bacterium]